MNSGDVIKQLKADGFRLDRTKGSHHHFVKGDLLVTVPHPKRDLPIGTLRSIFRQAGWSWPPR